MRAENFMVGGLIIAALLIGFYIGFVLWEPSPSIKPLTVEKTVPGPERTVEKTALGPERTIEKTVRESCEGTLPDTGGRAR